MDPFDLTGLDKKQRYRVRQVISRPGLTKAKRRELVTELVARLRGSTLEQRAEQARTDYERAGHLNHYATAVRERRAKPPIVVLTPESPPRYFLGLCLRCDRDIWVHRARPRVPVCDSCRGKR